MILFISLATTAERPRTALKKEGIFCEYRSRPTNHQMMNGFFVSITNNLLEDKHFERMGNAVWLYMWLIDRMTEISEGQGIVNNGHPITYDMVAANFGTMSLRTYQRMITTLRDAGYINTMQAKYGLYITINKAKKQFNKRASSPAKSGVAQPLRPAKSGVAKKSSYAKSGEPAVPKVAHSPAKSGVALYIDNNTITNTSNNTIKGDRKSPAKNAHRENVSKLYYEAIKALDLPVRNHNNVKAKITEMAGDRDHEKIINYLTFMRDQFATVDWEFKPHISEALDIFNKRGAIRDTFRKHVKTSSEKQSTAWRPKNKGAKK